MLVEDEFGWSLASAADLLVILNEDAIVDGRELMLNGASMEEL